VVFNIAEMVPLALWSKNVPDTDHCALADRLLAVKSAADLNRCRTDRALTLENQNFQTIYGDYNQSC